ncbi:D-beta-hydroxybutyrate dehydrogenase [Rhodovastum atsumiense]|uniref:3-hydroxybutyrate dehydrogenase n=1 Tax=Rhodovastum atsumiense TaxID=504468 RepID=A0A5M6ILW4_9PROT|nr:3-hydroxybutyrate dehydrogenase [Rhodovastum atsumiense]KAA5608555.1 3-hydroxybutyrate dehydrogenase [Rhodovastum atsumiense]CAH2599972.1 D-beta-hydroxybutyrate dehydrogenase [Rhodovastum atsumiense]
MSLKGRIALVTGSTSGIGLGIARALAAEGADIVLNGFGALDEIEAVKVEIAAKGVRVAYHGADISRPDQVAGMVEQTQAEFGGLDILVNNAGVQHVASIAEFPAEQWDRVIAINLSGAFHATKAAIPGMTAKGWGRIINVASAHGLVASPQKAAYVAAKHGIIGLTKVAGIELANTGVTCNAICPGWVLTPLVQKQIEDRARREGRDVAAMTHDLLTEKQPMAKFSTPESIGAVAVFLCSDAAATITGTQISVDGGWTAQ